MRAVAGILYIILLISVVVTIVTGNSNPTVIKAEALIFIAITVIAGALPKNANNNQQD